MRRPIDDVIAPITCHHGGRSGRNPATGEYWCPVCRREVAAAAAEAKAREEAHRAHLEYLRRLGWRRGRPPVDGRMRAAGEHIDTD